MWYRGANPFLTMSVIFSDQTSAHMTEDEARTEADRLTADGWEVEWGRRGDDELIPGSGWIDARVGNPGWIVHASKGHA